MRLDRIGVFEDVWMRSWPAAPTIDNAIRTSVDIKKP
jgi:hypothetical protein